MATSSEMLLGNEFTVNLVWLTIVLSGSENNSLYIYYKGLCKQLMTFKFDTVRSVLEKERREEDANEFVSAVCWRPVSYKF